jgi:hypothetical protein
VITGQTASYGIWSQGSVWIIETVSSGIEMCNSNIDYQRNDQGRESLQTYDGGYIVVGITENF